MVFDDRNSCASTTSIPLERATTVLISNKKHNSPASQSKNPSTTCTQKIDSSNHEAFVKDPDCAPICGYKKKTVMFTTILAWSPATSDHSVSRAENWYTSKELAEMTKLAKSELQIARLSGKETNEKDSLRGLESGLSIQANQEMKGRKVGVTLAVLNEQKRQRTIGVSDAKRIRMKSKMASRKSKSLAIELAEHDAKEVLEREAPSLRATGKGRGLPDYSSPRKNTRTNSLRRLSSLNDRKLSDLPVPFSSRKFLDPLEL
jgi:hypothetical protein